MLKPSLDKLLEKCYHQEGLYWLSRGPDGARERLYLLVGTHGNEIAGPISLQTLEKLTAEEWRWPNVEMIAVFQDPKGWAEEGYGFVGLDEGDESMWPPMWGYRLDGKGYWFYVDENSAWGNNVVQTPRHHLMKDLMAGFKPTFTLSLHETAYSETERQRFWAGANLTLIETWPIASDELSGVTNWVGHPLRNFASWTVNVLVEWLRDMVGVRRYRLASRHLKENPHFQLTTKIAERYVESGGELTGKRWMRYLEAAQQLVIAQGRLMHDQLRLYSEWRTATDYAVSTYGCPGVTTETMPCGEVGIRGIDKRVEQQFLYTLATLETLERRDHEDS